MYVSLCILSLGSESSFFDKYFYVNKWVNQQGKKVGTQLDGSNLCYHKDKRYSVKGKVEKYRKTNKQNPDTDDGE